MSNVTDPRVAELLRRRQVIREAKLAKLRDGTNDRLDKFELDALGLEAPDVTAARRRAEAVRDGTVPARGFRRGPLRKCVSCGHKLNHFDGLCHSCDADQPSAADCKPVKAQSPPPPPEEGPVPPAMDHPASNGVHAPDPVKTCPTCGDPTHPTNGRCYACRPGGNHGPRSARGSTGAKVEATASRVEATALRRGRAPEPPMDPEVSAIAGCLHALDGLDGTQLARVLDYVTRRVKGEDRP